MPRFSHTGPLPATLFPRAIALIRSSCPLADATGGSFFGQFAVLIAAEEDAIQVARLAPHHSQFQPASSTAAQRPAFLRAPSTRSTASPSPDRVRPWLRVSRASMRKAPPLSARKLGQGRSQNPGLLPAGIMIPAEASRRQSRRGSKLEAMLDSTIRPKSGRRAQAAHPSRGLSIRQRRSHWVCSHHHSHRLERKALASLRAGAWPEGHGPASPPTRSRPSSGPCCGAR